MVRKVAIAMIGLASAGGACPGNEPFVTVRAGRFELAGQPHAFVGANFWQGMNLAVDGPGGDRLRLADELDRLKRLGITNLRVMAASEGPNTEPQRMTPALMTAPGVYDARVLDGLDYLVAQAGARGMRLVMVLNNYWQWSGGMAQYVSWYDSSPILYPTPDDWETFGRYAARFYEIPQCQSWYRDHIAAIVGRDNRYTGVRYHDDPAIFAWELANEPRGYPAGWIDATAAYIKSLDANHLVTTGSEGSVGGDFQAAHAGPHIDYATVHIWPQNWQWFDPRQPATYPDAEARALTYLREHAAAAAALGKPLVLEEFGLPRDWEPHHDLYAPESPTRLRDQFYAALYREVRNIRAAGGPVCGDNFWAWAGQARPGGAWMGDPPHEQAGWYSVYDADTSTLGIIAHHAAEMAAPLAGDDLDRDGDVDLADFAARTRPPATAPE